MARTLPTRLFSKKMPLDMQRVNSDNAEIEFYLGRMKISTAVHESLIIPKNVLKFVTESASGKSRQILAITWSW